MASLWLPWTELRVSPACATHSCGPCCGELPAGNSQRGSSCAGHVQQGILYGYSLWHIYQGVHQNHPTAVQIPVVTCLFCNNQDKSGKADLPGVRGQTELQQGLKATGSKLVLALMFSSVVWNFFFLFLLMGKGMHFFTSPSSLKSPQRVYGGIL